MYEFTFPFRPPMEDCRMQRTSPNGAVCYTFDTISKTVTTKERQQLDAKLIRLYNDIHARRAAEELEKQ